MALISRTVLSPKLCLNPCVTHLGKLGLSAQIEQFIEELLSRGNDSRIASVHGAREDECH